MRSCECSGFRAPECSAKLVSKENDYEYIEAGLLVAHLIRLEEYEQPSIKNDCNYSNCNDRELLPFKNRILYVGCCLHGLLALHVINRFLQ